MYVFQMSFTDNISGVLREIFMEKIKNLIVKEYWNRTRTKKNRIHAHKIITFILSLEWHLHKERISACIQSLA